MFIVFPFHQLKRFYFLFSSAFLHVKSFCARAPSDFEYELNMHCRRVFSSPDIHISSFWIRIKRQVMTLQFKSRNLYVKTPARAWIKCRGQIYILFKLILNINNAANVVLHTAIKTKVLVLFRSCCLIGKSLKRVEVPCLFYVIWLKTIHTLNYCYYSIYLKNVECLKNNYHNTGKTGLYWFSRPPNYTYQSCFYNHYPKNE